VWRVAREYKASSEWGRLVGDAEFRLLTVGTGRRLWDEHLRRVVSVESFVGVSSFAVWMMFGEMGISALDLNKAFAANGLITTSGVIQVRRVCQETDRTLISILVQEDLERLAVDKGIVG
jgi:hypothetical protein